MNQLKRRLLVEQLDELLTWLETDERERPELFGTRDEYEWLLRLATVALSLLERHQLDRTGRCTWCHHPRRGWRRLVPRWHGRAPCLVQQTAGFVLRAEPEVVWWQALSLRGDDITLDEVRAWLASATIPRQPGECPVLAGHEIAGGRHALSDDRPAPWQENAAQAGDHEVHAMAVRPYARGGMPTERLWAAVGVAAEVPTQELPKIT